jgi:hypothetical protein
MAKGLYANIHAKRKRIKEGSKEKMRKKGAKGAPTDKAFKQRKLLRSLRVESVRSEYRSINKTINS